MKPKVPDGYTVKYQHERLPENYESHHRNAVDSPFVSPKVLRKGGFGIYTKGGRTTARIFDSDGNLVAEGVALCRRPNPAKNDSGDAFNRRIGRDVALGRALKVLKQKDVKVELVH